MNWKKFAALLVAGMVLMAGVVWASGFRARPGAASDRLKVVASFYPMGELVRQVGGDKVEVTVLVGPGVEPHDYDPSPRDMAGVHRSKVLVYHGAGLEPWADKVKAELQAAGTVVVNASEGLPLVKLGAGQEGSGFDPHVWLDPVLLAREVDAVRDGLVKADPSNRSAYEQNAEAYRRRLDGLDAAFREGLAQCGRHEIVTAHQAFGYLAAQYGFETRGIAGLSPDEEPSPQKLAEVAEFVRDRGVKYIFFETLASPRLAETMAREVGAKTLVFNPLEGLTGEEIERGKNYINVQHENLENLRIALDCK